MSNNVFQKLGVLIGVRDVVFAKLTKDDSTGVTYDAEIKQAPGVIEVALTANVTNEQLGADDVEIYEILSSLNGFDVSVTMASLGTDCSAYLLGGTVDSNGVLIDKSDDQAPYVAMGFKTARSDGSDDYIWLYKGKFGHSDATFRTKEKGQVNWQTPALTASFGPRIKDKAIRARVNTNDTAFATAKATFFTTVYPQAAQSGS